MAPTLCGAINKSKAHPNIPSFANDQRMNAGTGPCTTLWTSVKRCVQLHDGCIHVMEPQSLSLDWCLRNTASHSVAINQHPCAVHFPEQEMYAPKTVCYNCSEVRIENNLQKHRLTIYPWCQIQIYIRNPETIRNLNRVPPCNYDRIHFIIDTKNNSHC